MLDIGSCVQIDEKIYFTSYTNYPGLYAYNTKSDSLQVIEFSEKHKDWGSNGYFRVAHIGNFLVCLPYYTKDFLIYDTVETKSCFIPKKNSDIRYRSFVCFAGSLYMFPNGEMYLNDIAVFEPDNHTITYPFNNKEKCFTINQYSNVAIDENIVYLTLSENNKILKINLYNGDYEVITIGKRQEKYGVIVNINGKFILTGNNEYIYVWDGNYGLHEIGLRSEKRNDTISWEQKFSGVVLMNNLLVFSPLNYPCIVGLEIDTFEVYYIKQICSEQISWGIDKLNNEIVVLNLFDINGNKGELLQISKKGSSIEVKNSNMLELDKNVDLCICGKEFSKYALGMFINNIINGD